MRFPAACIAALCPALALAGGRAPLTDGVQFRPGDPRSIYVATTFGLLISHDDGCSFRWVCEQNLGDAGAADPTPRPASRPASRPKYRIARDGAILAATYRGLRVSRDGGCSFTTATSGAPAGDPGRIADAWIDAIDVAPTGDVWVATADSGKPNDVYRSTDGGRTFRPAGLLSPSIWWKSVAVAPSRARRIYATGYQVAGRLAGGGQRPPAAHLEISDDTGARWQESPLRGVAFGALPQVLVLGVDPQDPDTVLLVSSLASAPGDRLYRSSDGGTTWTDVLDTTSPIVDLAALPDGGVLVAAGAGAFRSTDHGASFQPVAHPPQLACIGQRGDGAVFGCAAGGEPDFQAVARSRDGLTWSKVFRFAELAGPLACPAGTAQHDTCAAAWPALQQQLGATGPGACPTPRRGGDLPSPPTRASGGCCDAGAPDGLGAMAMLAGLCGTVALRRRR